MSEHESLCLSAEFACEDCQTNQCLCDVIRRARAEVAEAVQPLLDALEFYADPATYHAIGFFSDPPCGEFMEDFSEDHGDDFYQRPMPGKTARAALAAWDTGGTNG